MDQTLVHKAVNLLCLFYPDKKVEEIVALSIGERDAKLMLIREWMFGKRLQNMALCPKCSERNEWETDIRDLMLQIPESNAPPLKYIMKEQGYTIYFRLPDSKDLFEVINEDEGANENKEHTRKLLKRLVLDSKFNRKSCSFEELPETILTALDRKIQEKNQQADIQMAVHCVSCGHQWEIQFDIMSYLWSEMDNWARHILNDVGQLAYTYGWTEHDILKMSPARRQIYLDMALL